MIHNDIPLNDSHSYQGFNQSESISKCFHELYYPKQPNQSNELEPSIGSPILDNPSFRSIKRNLNSKQIDIKQCNYPNQKKSIAKRGFFQQKLKTLFQSYSQYLEKQKNQTKYNQLKLILLVIWQNILMIQFIFMVIYIPIQFSYQISQSNIYLIVNIIINSFLYFNSQKLVDTQHISDQSILLKHFLKNILLKDFVLFVLYLGFGYPFGHQQISDQLRNRLPCDHYNHLSVQKEPQQFMEEILVYIYVNSSQFKLDFYYENLAILVFKILIILNIITCFNSALERNDFTQHREDSFIISYIASTKICLSFLTLNYQGDQFGIEIYLISFFSIFVVVYLLHSFHIILNEKGIEIHNFINSNNFDFVLREKLLNSIAKQRFDSKIHFPQRLSDEIKVNQRLPLLHKYFKGYDTSHLKDIAIQSEEIAYYPSEFIIKEDVPDDSSLYFLMNGYAEIQSSGFTLQSISAPDVFGEMSFYTQQPRLASVVALTQCLILKVPRQVMIAGLRQTEKELFHEQKDQISLYSNLPIECFCCKSNKHCIAQCNVFRIQINPEITRSVSQTRREYIRKQKKSLRIIPEQKKSKETQSPTKTDLQRKVIPFVYEKNKSEPLLQPASIFEQKSSKSIGILNNDNSEQHLPTEKYQQQKQNQFQCVSEEAAEYSKSSESYLNTNQLPSFWDTNPPLLQSESKISKIQNNYGESISPLATVPHNNIMSMSSFQEQVTQIQNLQFMIIKDFDQCQLFQHYFPRGNFDIVILNQKID